MDLNVTTIMGRLTHDPELRRGRSGAQFVTFNVALNRRWKDDKGTPHEESAYVSCIGFGRLAEWAAEHHQGETVVLTGRLRTDSWETDGSRRSRLVLVVETQQFVQPLYGARTPCGTEPNADPAKKEMAGVPF